MNKKVEMGLALGVIVLLVLFVLAYMLRSKPVTQVSEKTQTTATTANTQGDSAQTAPPVQAPALPETTAKIFVERFGSYSSESNFANITDVLPLSTSGLQAKLNGMAKPASTSYYGISTKVISQTVSEQTDAAATLVINTQRSESVGSPGNTSVRYQTITLKMLKDGDTWKVDDFTWGS